MPSATSFALGTTWPSARVAGAGARAAEPPVGGAAVDAGAPAGADDGLLAGAEALDAQAAPSTVANAIPIAAMNRARQQHGRAGRGGAKTGKEVSRCARRYACY